MADRPLFEKLLDIWQRLGTEPTLEERYERIAREIETSGVRRPPPIPANAVWNWSPKLSSATENADATWQYADQFKVTDQYLAKVVVDGQGDWYELLLRLERAARRDRPDDRPDRRAGGRRR